MMVCLRRTDNQKNQRAIKSHYVTSDDKWWYRAPPFYVVVLPYHCWSSSVQINYVPTFFDPIYTRNVELY